MVVIHFEFLLVSSLSREPACNSLVCKLRRADWRLHSLIRQSIKCSLCSQGHYLAVLSFLFVQWNNPGERLFWGLPLWFLMSGLSLSIHSYYSLRLPGTSPKAILSLVVFLLACLFAFFGMCMHAMYVCLMFLHVRVGVS